MTKIVLRAIGGETSQGNQDSSENQKNVIQEQRPDTENRHTQQKTYKITKIIRTEQQK